MSAVCYALRFSIWTVIAISQNDTICDVLGDRNHCPNGSQRDVGLCGYSQGFAGEGLQMRVGLSKMAIFANFTRYIGPYLCASAGLQEKWRQAVK